MALIVSARPTVFRKELAAFDDPEDPHDIAPSSRRSPALSIVEIAAHRTTMCTGSSSP